MNIYTRLSKKVKPDVSLLEYWEYDPYLLWIPKANVSGFGSYSSFKMNNYSFRNDYDITKQKPQNTFRIIILGGSVAWGTGATSNQEVWSAVLEKSLNSNGHKIEVLNAGCAGYISFQELVYLQFKLLEFSPDLVIVFDGYNDMFMASLYDEAKYAKNTSPYYENERDFYKQPLLARLAGLIKESSNFFKLLKRAREKLLYEGGRPMYDVKYVNRAGISNYFDNIKSVSDILKGRKIKAIFLLQPYIGESKKPFSEAERKMLEKARQEIAVMKEMTGVMRSSYRNFAAREGVIFYDLSNIFDNLDSSRTVWYDHVHLNDYGQKILGERLKEIVAGQINR